MILLPLVIRTFFLLYEMCNGQGGCCKERSKTTMTIHSSGGDFTTKATIGNRNLGKAKVLWLNNAYYYY